MKPREQPESPNRYATGYHAPVLCHAVVDGLVTDRDGRYVDATLGGGGHTAALLEALSPEGKVVGVDQDRDAIEEAGRRLRSDIQTGRLLLIQANFAELEHELSTHGMTPVDGVLLDLGVSSHQLDVPDRGFSYREDGPLDMRMDPEQSTSANDWVNEADASELTRILFEFGEERAARRITRAIVKARPVTSTAHLADVVRSQAKGFGATRHKLEHKMLARVFQALRIAVNRELESLETVLQACTDLVRPGGRLAVISYHSLEDRRVKRYIRTGNFEGRDHRDLYGNRLAPWRELTRGALVPEADEMEDNPRSRSARLRIAERIDDSDQDAVPPGAHNV